VLAAEAAFISGQPAVAAPDGPPAPAAEATAESPSEKEIAESDLAWAAGHAKGSKAWAIREARRTGKKVVATDETTPTTYTVANPDGTLTTELTSGPERVWRNGAWRKVDVTLAENADGSVTPKAHPNGLRLGGKGGTPPATLRAAQGATARDLVTLGSGDSKVTLQWKGGLPRPELDGTRARYRDAVPGADVIVEATRTGFEQFVEIHERPSGAYSYTLPVKAEGLEAQANQDGSVTFRDARTGAAKATMPAPVMWDSAVDKVSGEHTNRARVDMKVVDKGAGEIDLVVTPSAEFLADPDTKFPVTVDPSTSALTNTFDTYVQQGETVDWSTDVELDFGNPGTKNADGTPRTARSFITWNTTPIQDALIVDTNLALWNFHSGNAVDCSAQEWTVWDTGAPSTSSRWSAQPTWKQQYHSSTQTKGNADCAATQPDGWINADVDTLVQSWASAKVTRGHMGLRAATDDTRAWKRVNSANNAANQPKLSVTYNYRPSDGTSRQAGAPFKSYAGVWAVNTTTPTLRDTFTDPDGDTVNGTFQVYDAATNTPITTPSGEGLLVSDFVASGKPASVTVPAGQLKDGRTYKFRTNAYDGTHYNLSWSPWTQFVVDTTAPGAPDVTSATYPENWPGGATGEQGRFDVDTRADDAREVQYRVGPADTDDDGNSANTSPDGWQSTPATLTRSLTASFYVTPTADGNHQAEVRTVDRADNTGATRVYGFASPRRTDTGRAKKVDIDLPTPNIAATAPAYHDGPQPAWEWLTVRRGGTVADGEPQVYRSEDDRSRTTVTVKPLARLERTPEELEQLQTQPRPRLADYPDPIIEGSWCDPTLVNIEARMTRTEACLPQQVSYRVEDLSTPPKVYQQIFDVLYMVKVDPVGTKIKTWMQILPKSLGFAPNLPFPGGTNGMITLDVQSWCQSDGCDKQAQDWDFYGGKSTWNGNQDQHIITGIADFEWNGSVANASGTKDKDLSKVMPLRWWMDWGNTIPGLPVQDDSKGPSLPVTVRCDKVVSGKDPGCVLPAYKPGYTVNAEAFPGAAAHIWLIQNKHAKQLGKSPLTPLHYLPSKARNAPSRETENKLDNGKPGNRKAICGRGFRKHPDTATIATPSGNPDPISCDEFPFASTYESSGFPAADGGLNAAKNPDYAGLECVQTVVAKGDGTREHLYNDTTYDDPVWPALCGRSSMSNYVNTQSMQPFGVSFAKQFRLLDRDEYWVDPDNARFASCDPSQDVIKCSMK
jgi:hypothetical protein